MNNDLIDLFRNIIHISSFITVGLIALAVLVGMLRPGWLKRFLHEFAERKYILAGGIFVVMLCATTIVATEAPDKNTYQSKDNKGSVESSQSLNQSQQPAPAQETQPIQPTDTPAYATQPSQPNNSTNPGGNNMPPQANGKSTQVPQSNGQVQSKSTELDNNKVQPQTSEECKSGGSIKTLICRIL